MAIYTASYFQPQTYHGDLIPISRGIPPQCQGKVQGDSPLRWLLAPSKDLLDWWKRQEERAIDFGWEFPRGEVISQYTAIYREELAIEFPKIKAYLDQLDPAKDETWLCYEAPGEFCHRNLAYALVERYRPDCLGGQDVKRVEEPEARSPISPISPEESLYRWFLDEFQCPSEPFSLKPCDRVTNPERWLPVVRAEVELALRYLNGEVQKPSPRHYTGALQSELKILREELVNHNRRSRRTRF